MLVCYFWSLYYHITPLSEAFHRYQPDAQTLLRLFFLLHSCFLCTNAFFRFFIRLRCSCRTLVPSFQVIPPRKCVFSLVSPKSRQVNCSMCFLPKSAPPAALTILDCQRVFRIYKPTSFCSPAGCFSYGVRFFFSQRSSLRAPRQFHFRGALSNPSFTAILSSCRLWRLRSLSKFFLFFAFSDAIYSSAETCPSFAHRFFHSSVFTFLV